MPDAVEMQGAIFREAAEVDRIPHSYEENKLRTQSIMLPAVTMIKVLTTNLIYLFKKCLIIDTLGWEQSWVLDLLLMCCVTVCLLLDLSGLKTLLCR